MLHSVRQRSPNILTRLSKIADTTPAANLNDQPANLAHSRTLSNPADRISLLSRAPMQLQLDDSRFCIVSHPSVADGF